MFERILLKQIKGTKLQFRPESQMGFTSGDNYVSVQVQSYVPGNSSVSLSFFAGAVPKPSSFGESSATFFLKTEDLLVGENGTVNPVIVEAATQAAIAHLKSFNIGSEFEVVQFEA